MWSVTVFHSRTLICQVKVKLDQVSVLVGTPSQKLRQVLIGGFRMNSCSRGAPREGRDQMQPSGAAKPHSNLVLFAVHSHHKCPAVGLSCSLRDFLLHRVSYNTFLMLSDRRSSWSQKIIRHWRCVLITCLRESIFCHSFTFSSHFPTRFKLLHHCAATCSSKSLLSPASLLLCWLTFIRSFTLKW